MRRGIVVLPFLAAAIITFAPGTASADPSGPCQFPDAATHVLNAPGTLNGTSGDDIMFGSYGADIINGKGGNDIICGNGGADLIDGGTGHDRIIAVDGSTIYGGLGNDEIYAYGGAWVDGGAGHDYIYVTGGTVFAQSGNDIVENDYEPATVDCGSGNDSFWDGTVNINSLPAGVGVSCESERRPA